jgi:hypothetical protein
MLSVQSTKKNVSGNLKNNCWETKEINSLKIDIIKCLKKRKNSLYLSWEKFEDPVNGEKYERFHHRTKCPFAKFFQELKLRRIHFKNKCWTISQLQICNFPKNYLKKLWKEKQRNIATQKWNEWMNLIGFDFKRQFEYFWWWLPEPQISRFNVLWVWVSY